MATPTSDREKAVRITQQATQQVGYLEADLVTLREKLSREQRDHTKAIADLDKVSAELEQQDQDTIQARLDGSQRSWNPFKKSRAKAERQLAELSSQLDVYVRTIDQLKQQIDDTQAELAEATRKSHALAVYDKNARFGNAVVELLASLPDIEDPSVFNAVRSGLAQLGAPVEGLLMPVARAQERRPSLDGLRKVDEQSLLGELGIENRNQLLKRLCDEAVTNFGKVA